MPVQQNHQGELSLPPRQCLSSRALECTKEIDLDLPRLQNKQYQGCELRSLFKTNLSQLSPQLQEAYWTAVSDGFSSHLEDSASGLVRICQNGETVDYTEIGSASLAPGKWEERIAVEFSRIGASKVFNDHLSALQDLAADPSRTEQEAFVKADFVKVLGLGTENDVQMRVKNFPSGIKVTLCNGERILASMTKRLGSTLLADFKTADNSGC